MKVLSPLLLGVDLGTSAIKAILLSPSGVIATEGLEYPSLTPREGWVEQLPQTWVDTTLLVIKRLLEQNPNKARQVNALGFSGQMHGTVLLDANGKPLRPAIIWADQRSQKQVDRLTETLGKQEILRMTGNPLFPGFMLPTLLWLRENEPETWQQCRRSLLPKDYLRFIFTGEYFSEPSDASSTSLFNLNKRSWNLELLDRVGLDISLLPPMAQSIEPAGTLRKEIASILGLSVGIPVICGGSDQACQAVGNGVIDLGTISCTIGSGGQIFAPLDRPEADPFSQLHLFCHVIPNLWHLEAATLSAGLSLRWLRDLFGRYSYQDLADMAAEISPGSEGLIFAPYLLGERTPYLDSALRAGFLGISIQHQTGHFARAVMEGVVFSLRQGLDLILEKVNPVGSITASGGASHHPLWLQLQADIFNLPVVVSKSIEPAAMGAAILAGVGSGIYKDVFSASGDLCQFDEPVLPRSENVKVYADKFSTFQQLYPSLEPFARSTEKGIMI